VSPFLSVVICSFNRLGTLPGAIESVLTQSKFSQLTELIVVDDGSTDGTAEWLKAVQSSWPANTRILSQANKGLSSARNVGAAEARGEWIAFIDDDALVSPEWLGSLVDACRQADSGIAIIGGPIRLKWEQPRPSWLPASLEPWLTTLDLGAAQQTSVDAPMFRGANMTCRASALRSVGGFSCNLGRKGASLLSREECELNDRLIAANFASRYEPKPWVWHCVHSDRLSRRWFWRRLYWEGVSLQRGNRALDELSVSRRKARALLYALKSFTDLRVLYRAIRFDASPNQTEAIGHLAYQLGAAQGIWQRPTPTPSP
jgi:glucosyl-dolichyl phosphate glucuronosyltransferase